MLCAFLKPICELIIGNISGAREPDDPNLTWGYVARTKEQETQTMKMDMADDMEAKEEWCELFVDRPENEESDSCSESKRTADERCLEEIKTAPRPTTKKKVRSFLKLSTVIETKFHCLLPFQRR